MSLGAFRLGFVSVHVRDLGRARAFYEGALGLRVVQQAGPDEAFYDLGGVPLSVHVDADGSCGRAPGGETGIYLQVADLAAARERLAEAGVAVAWEEGNALGIRDPDGNEYVLWQPRAPWPPALPAA